MEKDYKQLFEEAYIPMIILTLEGHYINHNKAYRKLMGYRAKESLLNFSPMDVSPEYQPNGQLSSAEVKRHNQFAMQNEYHEFAWMHKSKDGSEFLSMVRLERIAFENKDCLKASIFDLDEERKISRIVDEKVAEISEKNKLLEIMFENDMVGMMYSNGKRIIDRANRKMANILKCSVSDIEGDTMRKFVFDDDTYNEFGIKMKEAMLKGCQYNRELLFRAFDGSKVWCALIGRALDASIPPDFSQGFIWIVADITIRKQLEVELKQQYELAKDSNPLTGLPGNNSIKKKIEEIIQSDLDYCDMY